MNSLIGHTCALLSQFPRSKSASADYFLKEPVFQSTCLKTNLKDILNVAKKTSFNFSTSSRISNRSNLRHSHSHLVTCSPKVYSINLPNAKKNINDYTNSRKLTKKYFPSENIHRQKHKLLISLSNLANKSISPINQRKLSSFQTSVIRAQSHLSQLDNAKQFCLKKKNPSNQYQNRLHFEQILLESEFQLDRISSEMATIKDQYINISAKLQKQLNRFVNQILSKRLLQLKSQQQNIEKAIFLRLKNNGWAKIRQNRINNKKIITYQNQIQSSNSFANQSRSDACKFITSKSDKYDKFYVNRKYSNAEMTNKQNKMKDQIQAQDWLKSPTKLQYRQSNIVQIEQDKQLFDVSQSPKINNYNSHPQLIQFHPVESPKFQSPNLLYSAQTSGSNQTQLLQSPSPKHIAIPHFTHKPHSPSVYDLPKPKVSEKHSSQFFSSNSNQSSNKIKNDSINQLYYKDAYHRQSESNKLFQHKACINLCSQSQGQNYKRLYPFKFKQTFQSIQRGVKNQQISNKIYKFVTELQNSLKNLTKASNQSLNELNQMFNQEIDQLNIQLTQMQQLDQQTYSILENSLNAFDQNINNQLHIIKNSRVLDHECIDHQINAILNKIHDVSSI